MRGRRHPTDATPSGDEGKHLAWALAFGIRLAILPCRQKPVTTEKGRQRVTATSHGSLRSA